MPLVLVDVSGSCHFPTLMKHLG